MYHTPVLLKELVENLDPKDGETYLDTTFGAGGHTRAILEKAECNVIAIDRDPTVRRHALKVNDDYEDRFRFKEHKFSEIGNLIQDQKYDGIIFDLGVSSMQLDKGDRGFSFQQSASLDMRMGKGELTAYDIVNFYDEDQIADIIYKYGDEKKSRRIAREIVVNRRIVDTVQLADIVRDAYGGYRGKIDPATKTFQALRIYVNDELGEIEKALASVSGMLNKDGRLVVISFHSLEDSIVKKFMKGDRDNTSRYEPDCCKKKNEFYLPKKWKFKPSKEEVQENPRSRSAVMRIAIKT